MVSDETSREIVERYKAYFRLTPQDLEVVAAFREMGESEVDAFLDSFYEHMRSFAENSGLFPDADTVARAQKGQREHFLSLFRGVWNEDNLLSMQNLARVHDRLNIRPWQFGGMFAFYASEMMRHFQSALPGQTAARSELAVQAWIKLVLMDFSITSEIYVETRQESLQNKVRELEALNRFASQRVDDLLGTGESLGQQGKRLEALTELGQVNFDEHIPEEAALRVLTKILDLMLVEAGEVWVVDQEGDRVMMVTQYGLFPTEFREITTLKLGEGFPGLVAATGQPLVTQELAEDTRFLRHGVVREGFRFFACVPLTAAGTVVGVLSIASRRQQPWDEERNAFLQAMGRLIGRRTLGLLLSEIRRAAG